MIFFILVGGSSRTTGDLIKPKKNSKKGPKTGQKRALEPELVDQSILNQADGTPEIPFYGSGVSRWVSFKEVSANGVIGSPSVATSAKGELLLEVASEGIAGVLQDPELWQTTIK